MNQYYKGKGVEVLSIKSYETNTKRAVESTPLKSVENYFLDKLRLLHDFVREIQKM